MNFVGGTAILHRYGMTQVTIRDYRLAPLNEVTIYRKRYFISTGLGLVPGGIWNDLPQLRIV